MDPLHYMLSYTGNLKTYFSGLILTGSLAASASSCFSLACLFLLNKNNK
jgi:hypothetical protein